MSKNIAILASVHQKTLRSVGSILQFKWFAILILDGHPSNVPNDN